MTATTIKLDSEVRDRLNALASERGLTAGSMVEKLLEEYMWRQKVERAKRQMRQATAEEWADYVAEFQPWDVTANDGLENDPWEA